MTTPENHSPERRRISNDELSQKLDALDARFTKQEKAIEGLLEAWRTAKGLSSFIKWASSLVLGAGILYQLFKDHLK